MELGLGFILILLVIIWIMYDENQSLKRKNSDFTTTSLGDERRLLKENERIKVRDNKSYQKILNKSNNERIDWLLSNINFQNDYLIYWTKSVCNNKNEIEFPYLFELTLELITLDIVNYEIDINIDQHDFLTRFITKRLFEIREKSKTTKSIPELNSYLGRIFDKLTENMVSNQISVESIKSLFLSVNERLSTSEEELIRVTRGTLLNYIESLRKTYKSMNI